MPCLPCQQQRQQLYSAVRQGDLRGAAQAVTRGVAVATDKMRGVDVAKKYGSTPIVKATPYRRPPERST